jgi:cytidine deaminase
MTKKQQEVMMMTYKTQDEVIRQLYEQAVKVREKAYVPYSGFKVGAALLGKSGKIFTGCNVENVSYGLTVCAERNAFFKAVSEGETSFAVLLVVADTPQPVSPCGACRQVMAEFGDFEVILSNLSYQIKRMFVHELLPYSFDKDNLNVGK